MHVWEWTPEEIFLEEKRINHLKEIQSKTPSLCWIEEKTKETEMKQDLYKAELLDTTYSKEKIVYGNLCIKNGEQYIEKYFKLHGLTMCFKIKPETLVKCDEKEKYDYYNRRDFMRHKGIEYNCIVEFD